MNDNNIKKDDMRITQYAVGEMSNEEMKEFENEFANCADVVDDIKDIKDLSSLLIDGFNNQEFSLSDKQKKSINNEADNICTNRNLFVKIASFAAIIILVCFISFQNILDKDISDDNFDEIPTIKIIETKLDEPVNDMKIIIEDDSPDVYNPEIEIEEVIKTEDEDMEVEDVIENIEFPIVMKTNNSALILPGVLEMRSEGNRMIKKYNKTNTQLEYKEARGNIKKPQSVKHLVNTGTVNTKNPIIIAATQPVVINATNGSRINSIHSGMIRSRSMKFSKQKWKAYKPMEPNYNTESYDFIQENVFKKVIENPLSTFSIDVDTASYSNMRRFLKQGTLPPKDSIRIEEMINYFNYKYEKCEDEKPFSVNFEAAECPWNKKNKLVMIALKGKEIEADKRPASNLVFLLDVSGSMSKQNKLPLLKKSFKLMLAKLGENDKISIVVYAGASGLVLPPTTADNKEKILHSLDKLNAGGSTNAGSGIKLAYNIAITNFIEGGINRVILATDGDFNVGITNDGDLTRLIEKSAKSGVFLSVLGFGMGNYKDSTLEKLADKGNGNYAYIDTINEAKKVLVNEIGSTLITIAKDVKIQVEFNPTLIEGYRLIGYENRKMAKEDFNNDKKDAGEIGAGHTVTAFYEIVLKGNTIPGSVDSLKYQTVKKSSIPTNFNNELMTVKLRYKKPNEDISKLLTYPLTNDFKEFNNTTSEFKFATAVVEFGMKLHGSQYLGETSFSSILDLATLGLTNDKFGYRKEFISLVKIAEKLNNIQ